MSNPSKTTVIVGLSGGVDSAVSAYLLKEQGYDVQGLFMKNWEEDDTLNYCSSEADLDDVKQVCKILDIPLHTVNFSHEYWQHVFSLFLEEYQKGRTPNPDILCNKEIKFKAFLDYAQKLGADKIATGHYAQNINNTLVQGLDAQKDQSYFLYTLSREKLQKTIFPVGGLEKKQVRKIAEANGFLNHNKKDSTGICFIGERKFSQFLNEYVLAKKGLIKTTEDEVIAEHAGLMFYTLGQRQGLGIGGVKGKLEKPWYVVAKALQTNTLYVTQDEDHPWHFTSCLRANQLSWVQGQPPAAIFKAYAKIRYRQGHQACEVTVSGDKIHVRFLEKQRAATPGQSIVLYDNNHCLGGGIIDTTDSPGGLNNSFSRFAGEGNWKN